jgi:poly-beta-1,6-N-acetyl-D-glucosamine N-deacetylase
MVFCITNHKLHLLNMMLTFRDFIAVIIGQIIYILGYVNKAKKKAILNNQIISIYFHNPRKKIFEKTIKWFLKNEYTFISTEQLIEIFKNKTDFPKRAVWLTFDDGFKDNLTNVVPIINKFNIPATFFIATQAIEVGYFWWTVAQKHKQLLPVKFYHLLEMDESKRMKIINDLVKHLPQQVPRETMTITDIKILSNNPLITFGSHTDHHTIVPNCTKKEFNRELENSILKLENWTGRKIKSFSFPNGDHNRNEIGILKKHNIEIATTTENDFVSLKSNMLFLPRFSLVDNGSFAENLCHMFGVWQPFIAKLKLLFRPIKSSFLYQKY